MSAEFVFWQDGLSIHQAPLISALAAKGHKTMIVVPASRSSNRRHLGWNRPSLEGTVVKQLAETDESIEVARKHRDAFHVMAGFGYQSHIQRAFWTIARNSESKIAIVSESWDPTGIKRIGRLFKYKIIVSRMRPHIDVVFTNGTLAAKQYRSVGIPRHKIRPFGYFVPGLGALPSGVNREFKIVFVGRLIPLKNVDMLLKALSQLPGDWSLTVIGDGPQRSRLENKVQRLRMAGKVSFLGVKENRAVHEYIASSDLLVLPSKYDGWGAVVNEALMNGTPAAVSTACGASELITGPLQGEVFLSRDVKSLTAVLRRRIAAGPLSEQERVNLKKWSEVSISPEAAANYLWQNIATTKPSTPPWRSRNI